jgi:Cellulose binding domain
MFRISASTPEFHPLRFYGNHTVREGVSCLHYWTAPTRLAFRLSRLQVRVQPGRYMVQVSWSPTFHDGFSCAKVPQLTRAARAEIAPLALALAAMAGPQIYRKYWRTALHVTASVLIAAILGLAITPLAHAAAATATLSVSSTWQTGFIAHFTITNSSVAPLTDWKLEFDLPVGESVSHTWNSRVTQSGTHYVLTPANWNRIIAPGGSATGGLRGVLTGAYVPPSNCLLNGQYPCT